MLLFISEVQIPELFDALSPEAQGEGMSWVVRGWLSKAAPYNPQLCLGATLAGVELPHFRTRPWGAGQCLRLGRHHPELLEILVQGFLCAQDLL